MVGPVVDVILDDVEQERLIPATDANACSQHVTLCEEFIRGS